MSFTDYDTCPVCGRDFQVKADGTLRHHLKPKAADSQYRTPRCPGAGQKPKDDPR